MLLMVTRYICICSSIMLFWYIHYFFLKGTDQIDFYLKRGCGSLVNFFFLFANKNRRVLVHETRDVVGVNFREVSR